jgi:hypothetical protein
MRRNQSVVNAAARAMVRAAAAEGRKAAGERSPSKVWKVIGEFMGVGLALGIEESTPTVTAAAEAAVLNAARAANVALGQGIGALQATIDVSGLAPRITTTIVQVDKVEVSTTVEATGLTTEAAGNLATKVGVNVGQGFLDTVTEAQVRQAVRAQGVR